MEEYKVGEEFQFGRIKLRVELCNNPMNCENCFFYKNRENCDIVIDAIGECSSLGREDEQSVKFVKVEEDEKH